jgi:hypothetical protein
MTAPTASLMFDAACSYLVSPCDDSMALRARYALDADLDAGQSEFAAGRPHFRRNERLLALLTSGEQFADRPLGSAKYR